jgi:RNA polymerase sigma factor (TIGR02999 family)
MERNKRGDVTEMLTKFRRGDPGAEAKLVELVYSQLRRLAADYMRRERKDHSLPPTALVHEAYLRLIKLQPKVWQNRAHFFAVAALLMRQILVDHARRRRAQKRGAGGTHLSTDDSHVQQSPQLMHEPQRYDLVDPRAADCDVMASIGHELQHAVEVLSYRSVTSASEMKLLYQRICDVCGPSVETNAAVRAGHAVRDELRENRGHSLLPNAAFGLRCR